MAVVCLLCLALAAASVGMWLSAHHPVSVPAALGLFALGAGLASWRQSHWMFALAALLPMLNFAPWTGWQSTEEFDLLLLGLFAGGYARLATSGGARRANTPPALSGTPIAGCTGMGVVVFGLLSLSLISLYRGWVDNGSTQPLDWFQGQSDPINGLRVFKGPAFAMLAMPLVQDAMRRNGARVLSRFASGMVAGLAVVAAATLWERSAYPGSMDMSVPYRTVALFWEMNVGGAALDIYLAVAMPFASWALWQARTPWRWAGSALLLMVATYAVLATFSRGVWLAVVASHLLLAALLLRRVFEPRLGALVRWLGLGMLGMVASVVLLVWAIDTGHAAAFVIMVLMACLMVLTARAKRLHWRTTGALFLSLLICAEVAAVAQGSGFASERVAASRSDLHSRLDHWQRGLALLQTPADWAVGLGLGRFPTRYDRTFPEYGFSGSARVLSDRPTPYLRLMGPTSRGRREGLFAMTQRIPLQAGKYGVSLSLGSATSTTLLLSVCELHLLYPRTCQSAMVDLPPRASPQHIEVPLRGEALSAGKWYAPRRAAFSVAASSAGSMVDIDQIRLVAIGPTGSPAEGHQVLLNGNFASGQAHWLPVAFNHFVPWHTDNLYLELLVERGLVGLLVFGGMAVWLLLRSMRRSTQALPLAPFFVASAAAVLCIGLVSSVLDAARTAFLSCFLLGCLGLLGNPDLSTPQRDAP